MPSGNVDANALLILHEHEQTVHRLHRELSSEFPVFLADSVEGARRLLENASIRVLLVSQSIVAASGPAFLDLLSTEFPRIRPLVVGSDVSAIAESVREVLAAPHDEESIAPPPPPEPTAGRSEVFGTAAHDLRNPLTVILSLTELMLNEATLGPEEMQQFLESIRANADEMHQLLDDVQEITRLESAEHGITRVDTPVAALLTEAAAEAGVAATIDVASSAERWSLDHGRMRRALSLLIADAATRSPNGVTVRADRDGEYLRIRIEDDGPPLAPEALDELRHSLRRGRRHKGATGVGTGLGPAVASRVIESHGGTIGVEVKHESGTRLVARVPKN
jgi:signal transduction histidine kinase